MQGEPWRRTFEGHGNREAVCAWHDDRTSLEKLMLPPGLSPRCQTLSVQPGKPGHDGRPQSLPRATRPTSKPFFTFSKGRWPRFPLFWLKQISQNTLTHLVRGAQAPPSAVLVPKRCHPRPLLRYHAFSHRRGPPYHCIPEKSARASTP